MVYDLVYKPTMTPLMKVAREEKLNYTNGFYMLARQLQSHFIGGLDNAKNSHRLKTIKY